MTTLGGFLTIVSVRLIMTGIPGSSHLVRRAVRFEIGEEGRHHLGCLRGRLDCSVWQRWNGRRMGLDALPACSRSWKPLSAMLAFRACTPDCS
jgi:hypothetical protein